MPTNTYVALGKVTVETATPSITFTGISQAYTDLVLIWSAKTSAAATVYGPTMYFNTDTARTNYSFTALYGTGSSALSFRWSTSTAIQHGVIAGTITTSNFNVGIVNINNYSNTTTFKTALSRSGDAGAETYATVGLWQNTAAINNIALYAPDGTANFTIGSTFSLYGIASASVGAKATGGTIYSDSQYYYHAFAASGTFTPTQSITADCLVVAGGGGASGGGGGAGGLLYTASQSLTTTGYTVTVGAGGAGATSNGSPSPNASNGSNSVFNSLTATGGGGGGGTNAALQAGSGGSGGGAGAVNGTPGNGTSGQGNNGGTIGGITGANYPAGGGGGAGAVGGNATSGTAAGSGGIGSSTYSSWGLATTTGQNSNGTVYYAGGGGGGMYNSSSTSTGATGGLGGGGIGSQGSGTNTLGLAGTVNTGGGAGGGNAAGLPSGGSGIIIIRYLKA